MHAVPSVHGSTLKCGLATLWSFIPMLFQPLLAIALALGVQIGAHTDKGLVVHTTQGDVIGTLVSPTVRRFLGIPYAVANRWEAPQSSPLRSAPFNASTFGDSCPQALNPANFLTPPGPSVSESEDCLNINIWAPSTRRKQRTAVMIWIYGGGFQFGTVCCRKVLVRIEALLAFFSE
jgi:Carboxylesterase family